MANGDGEGRKTSLPPELEMIDPATWSEEDPVTINRPEPAQPFQSEPPTLPRDTHKILTDRPRHESAAIPLRPSERVTAPPPPEAEEALLNLTKLPELRREAPTEPPAGEDLPEDEEEDDIYDRPTEDVFDRPTLDVAANADDLGFPTPLGEEPSTPFAAEAETPLELRNSELPTAPPPHDVSAELPRLEPSTPRSGPGARPAAARAQAPTPSARSFGGSPGRQPPPAERFELADDGRREMRDRFAMGDFSGALESAENLLVKEPLDQEAAGVAAKCRNVLAEMYSSRIAGLDRRVRTIMAPEQVRWLSLDHRSGFLLSMVDGVTSVEELLDVSGMPRLDAMKIICTLLDQSVIELD